MSTVHSLPELPELPETEDTRRTFRPLAAPRYELALELRGSIAYLTATGALDESSADAIEGIICADGPVACAIELVAAGIDAVDPFALELVVAAARERRQRGLPPVTVLSASAALAEAARKLGLPGDTPFALSGE